MVRAAVRDCIGVRDGWRRTGRDDSAARSAADHQPVGLARGICLTRPACLLAGFPVELALRARTIADSPGLQSRRAFRNLVAARATLVRLLDHHRRALFEFHQHEWSNHAPRGPAYGSRNHGENRRALRIPAWRLEFDRPCGRWLAAGSLFRCTRRGSGEPDRRSGPVAAGAREPLAAGLPRRRTDRYRGWR